MHLEKADGKEYNSEHEEEIPQAWTEKYLYSGQKKPAFVSQGDV